MCGFFEFDSKSAQAQALIRSLEIEEQSDLFQVNTGSGPASFVDIVIGQQAGLQVVPAIWWLLLDQNLKPSHYTSFNTRSDKLDVRNSAGYLPYRSHRCIVPATAIVEGEGSKGKRRYHRIEPENTAFALGGLYREWWNRDTGEQMLSCSIITLPPHLAWQDIHSKSVPLFLPHDDKDIIAKWLDPLFSDVEEFRGLLTPTIRDTLKITPVDRPSTQIQTGESFAIFSDADHARSAGSTT
ncbi:SOS response-associated peptidase family protein [uncultured Amphritea sp.]|uniref:SOS response-associated peptidase family protein n=1 Tax=uncultured Amphritea sp. TaxID=981605 RepID=UPI002614EA56|nr:SOS response-associated peptidase family protein [uncultured Amphritea sp.]